MLSLATALVALQVPVIGQKLNGPLTATNGRVHDAHLSGDAVVDYALQDGSASGQGPVIGKKLNGTISAPNGRVHDAWLSGEYVVYHALQDGTASGLYTTKLAPDYANQELYLDPAGVSAIEAAPVGERVLFRSGGALRSIPVDGSAGAALVHAALPQFTRPAQIVPGGKYAVYTGGTAVAAHLYRARIDGGEPPLVLAGPHVGFLGDPVVSADGSMVVFANRSETGWAYEIRGVPVQGGPPVLLSGGPLPLNMFPRYGVSPDGSRAVYIAEVVEPGRREVFSSRTRSQETPRRLHFPLRANESIGSLFVPGLAPLYYYDPPFAISPDGGSVAMVAVLHSPLRRFHLFQAPIGGGPLPARLASWPWPTPDYGSEDGFCLGNLAFDPTGRWIVVQVYSYWDFVYGRGRLFSMWSKGGRPPVELTKGVVPQLGALPPPRFDEPSFCISPDGSRVVFHLEGAGLFSAPIDGSAQAVPLVQFPFGRSVRHFEIHDQSVIYLANPLGPTFELFLVPLDGSQAPVKLSASSRNILRFRARPGEVIYFADQDAPGVQELYYSRFP